MKKLQFPSISTCFHRTNTTLNHDHSLELPRWGQNSGAGANRFRFQHGSFFACLCMFLQTYNNKPAPRWCRHTHTHTACNYPELCTVARGKSARARRKLPLKRTHKRTYTIRVCLFFMDPRPTVAFLLLVLIRMIHNA